MPGGSRRIPPPELKARAIMPDKRRRFKRAPIRLESGLIGHGATRTLSRS